jgi:hypothetical protein
LVGTVKRGFSGNGSVSTSGTSVNFYPTIRHNIKDSQVQGLHSLYPCSLLTFWGGGGLPLSRSRP